MQPRAPGMAFHSSGTVSPGAAVGCQRMGAANRVRLTCAWVEEDDCQTWLGGQVNRLGWVSRYGKRDAGNGAPIEMCTGTIVAWLGYVGWECLVCVYTSVMFGHV